MIKSEEDAYEVDADPQQVEDVMSENNHWLNDKMCSEKSSQKVQ